VKELSRGSRGWNRTKAIAVLAFAVVGFLIALLVGYRYFELFDGVVAGLIVLAAAAFIAYELWWKTNSGNA
jgi:type IV secretory pathway VirB2 component (pilin)